MKNIRRGPEPAGLQQHRREPDAAFANLPAVAKDEVRKALVRDQGAICCYCMDRIGPEHDRMKIEHWVPQSVDAGLELTWSNLLGACPGGMGGPAASQHCDTSRGNAQITIDPRGDIEHGFRYLTNGRIELDDPSRQAELDDLLCLNIDKLRRARRAVLEGMKAAMARKKGEWSRSFVERQIRGWRERSSGHFRPYCQVAVYWLQKRLLRG